MIHDSLAHLKYYAPILESFDRIEEVLASSYEEGTHQIGTLSVTVESYVPTAFTGTFRAHDSAATLVVMLQGEELFGLTYSERCKGAAKDACGWIQISDSPIKTVITAQSGMFTLFMPREPYALGIVANGSDALVKRMTIVLKP